MKKYLTAAIIAASVLAASASAENIIYLSCNCETHYFTLPSEFHGTTTLKTNNYSNRCTSHYFSVVVDLDKGTLEYKMPFDPKHEPVTAKFSTSSINAAYSRYHPNGTLYSSESITIDRINGTYSYQLDLEHGANVTDMKGVCTKADAPKF